MGLRVTVVELPAAWGDPRRALDDVDAILRGGQKTDLVVLPEACLTGYVSPKGDFDLTRFAEPIDGRTSTLAGDLAADHSIHLVAPLVLREGDEIYNAAVLYDHSGRAAYAYKKRHPWMPETWATPGPEPLPSLRIADLAVTIAICFDLHFLPVESAPALAAAKLLLFPSAWVDDQEPARLGLMAKLAKHFKLWVANANWGRGVVGYPGQGDSCIIDPTGAFVARVGPGASRADTFIESPCP